MYSLEINPSLALHTCTRFGVVDMPFVDIILPVSLVSILYLPLSLTGREYSLLSSHSFNPVGYQ